MADTTSAVNGVYGNQYGQPVELAASTPSAPSHAPSASQSTTTSATAQKADPTEIGWYFVEQYYTTLSKNPEKIHLFYNKKSQLVTGNEAEKVLPAVGARAISEKIKSLDIQDCKVRVLNVDSQASYSNIVVQVIGEMSNKNQPHHKFVQTFVLAEQPNGYFVLNDIFRYLSDDEDEIIDDEPTQPEAPAEEPATPAEPDESPVEENANDEAAAEQVDEELEEAKEEAPVAEEVPVNGDEAETAEEATLEEDSSDPVEEPSEPAAPADEPVTEEQPPQEESVEAGPPKVETSTPEAPPAKKTWASMLGGSKPVATSALPAQPAAPTQQPKAPRPVQRPQPTSTTSSEPTSTTPTSQSNGWQMAGDSKKGKSGPQAKSPDGNVLAYIKNVNEKVDARTLREVLERHGELKYFDVSRPRNCAFVEFATPEGYTSAVANNPHTVGSETISVEERRPRPGAYGGTTGTFPRGNGNASTSAAARGGRGNFPQRSGSQGSFPKDAGRSGFPQQRGGKSGTVTPKGRGQAQAA